MTCAPAKVFTCVLLFARLASVVSEASTECTFECQSDSCKFGDFYEYDEINKTCHRTDTEIRYFLLGVMYCGINDFMIHDNNTCSTLGDIARGAREPRFGMLFATQVNVIWNESSGGCRVWGSGPEYVQDNEFYARICLQSWSLKHSIASIALGMLLGLTLACIGVRCSPTAVAKKHFEDHMGRKEDFWPGAKVLAADHVVKGGGTRKLTLLYRVCETIANAWLPMVLLIFFNPAIVLSLYFLYYVIPAFMLAESDLFRQPIYLIAPPDVSLFGIDHIQPDFVAHYFFSAIRPFLMALSIYISVRVVDMTLSGSQKGFWTYNVSGYLRAGMMEGTGPLVLDFVVIGCAVGTLIHIIMTLMLVYQAWCNEDVFKAITLLKDETNADKIQKLAEQICDVAHDLEEEDASDTDEDLVQEKTHKLVELNVAPLGSRDVLIAKVMVLVDLASYAYKIWAFLRGGRYFLATIIVCALSESIFVLVLDGHFSRAPDAFRRAARDGVPTYDYLAMCQMHRGIAGVPKLMTTIYGLPLAGIHTWYATLSGILFIIAGTRAMGKYIVDVVDSDMFDVVAPDNLEEDTQHRSFIAYLGMVDSKLEAHEDEDEDEDEDEEDRHMIKK